MADGEVRASGVELDDMVREVNLPSQIHSAAHVAVSRRRLPGRMVDGSVVLKAYSHRLVAAHSRAHLRSPVCRYRARYGVLSSLRQSGFKRRNCLSQVRLFLPTLPRLRQAAREVNDAARVLVLVTMLPAFPGARKPRDLDVIRVNLSDFNDLVCRVKDGDGNGTSMYSSALFGRRYSLDAVPASLSLKRVDASAFRLNRDLMVSAASLALKSAAGLSSLF